MIKYERVSGKTGQTITVAAGFFSILYLLIISSVAGGTFRQKRLPLFDTVTLTSGKCLASEYRAHRDAAMNKALSVTVPPIAVIGLP